MAAAARGPATTRPHAEVRVEDVVAEVVAPGDGVVELLVPEGTGVHQGEVLARVA